MQKIPWNRISGWYSRGDVILKRFLILENGNKEEQLKAFKSIYNDIEHQNGIIYITPFVVYKLIELLGRKQTLIHQEIKEGLRQIKEVVNFHLDGIPKEELQKINDTTINFQFLCQEKYLFPPYENEDEEESLWLEIGKDIEHWTITYLLTKTLLIKL